MECLIVRTGKSEAEITNKRLHSRHCTVEAIEFKHEASRALSATAELLVRCAVTSK